MKELLLLLLIVPIIAYRFLSSRQTNLSSLPDNLYYISDDLMVVQTGANITIFNSTNDQSLNTFTADSENPDVQIFPSKRRIIYLTKNKTLLQIDPSAKSPGNITLQDKEVFWSYGLGQSNSVIMVPRGNSSGLDPKSILYIDLENQDDFTELYTEERAYQRVIGGSNVAAIHPDEYYFVGGGTYSLKSQARLQLYQGNSWYIILIYTFPFQGEADLQHPPEIKLEWTLRSLKVKQNKNSHALAVALNCSRPQEQTIRFIKQYSQDVFQHGLGFEVAGLIGMEMFNDSAYPSDYDFSESILTADTVLCRITQHYMVSYYEYLNFKSTNYFDKEIIRLVVDQSEKVVLGLTGTPRVFLTIYYESTKSSRSISDYFNPLGVPLLQGYFIRIPFSSTFCFVFRDSNSQLVTFQTDWPSTWQQNEVGKVVDYCVSQQLLVFAVVEEQNQTEHSLKVFDLDPQSYELVEVESAFLDYPVEEILCIPGEWLVLVRPADDSKPTTVWDYSSGTLEIWASAYLDEYAGVHCTKSMLYFTRPDHQSTPDFYTFSLNMFTDSGSLQLAYSSVFKVVQSSTDEILLAVGDSLDHLVTLDHYRMVSKKLQYLGSFPLRERGAAGLLERTVVFSKDNLIMIDYPNSTMVRYPLNQPPQLVLGIFQNKNSQSCTKHTQAKFRVNPLNSSEKQMVVIRGQSPSPYIERYSISGKSSAILVDSAYLRYIDLVSLTIRLSTDFQKVIVTGTKRSVQGIPQKVIQLRNANYLGQVLFEKVYPELEDTADFQGSTLYKDTVYSVIINRNFSLDADHFTALLNEPIGSSNVPTGVAGEISLYSTCSNCDLVAVYSIADYQFIKLISIDSGLVLRKVFVNCTVLALSLSDDAQLVGYLCSKPNVCVHDTITDEKVCKDYPYQGAYAIKVLTREDVLVYNGNYVDHMRVADDSGIIRKGQNQGQTRPTEDNTAKVKSAVDFKTKNYAVAVDPTKTIFSTFQGTSTDSFSVEPGENIVLLAFTPSGYLSILTDSLKLYTITPEPCPASQSNVGGYCTCEDGKYYVSPVQCQECSSFCQTCSGGGISDCSSYSTLFAIAIVLIVLLALGMLFGVVFYLMRKRRAQKDRLLEEDSGREALVSGKDESD